MEDQCIYCKAESYATGEGGESSSLSAVSESVASIIHGKRQHPGGAVAENLGNVPNDPADYRTTVISIRQNIRQTAVTKRFAAPC